MATRIFVGNLPIDIKEREIEDLFAKYGKIRDIDIKSPSRPPAFAFITYDDPRDADDAIHGRDGYQFDGMRLRVEISKVDRTRFGGGRDDDRGGDRGGGFARKTGGRRTDYGVLVSNLPRGCSWQDLKDFMRKAGDVVFTDVDRNGDGVVEFSNRDDMERAVDKLDDVEFKARDDSSYIRVKFAHKQSSSSGGRGRSRSRSASRSRSRGRDSRSRSRSKSISRSRSRDRVGSSSGASGSRRRSSRDRSVSRSRSRSPLAVRDDDNDGGDREEKVISSSSSHSNGDSHTAAVDGGDDNDRED